MTAALCIFAYVVGSFAIGVLFGRHINEGQRPPFAGDQTNGGDLTAADIKRVHSTTASGGAQRNHG